MFCAGTFDRNLDDKQRLLLPKAVKKTFELGKCLFLTPGFDRCLEIHNSDSIERRATKVRESTSDIRTQKSFSRLFFAQAEKCELDSQNRIRIPQRLVEWAKLESRNVILGAGEVWEIWGEGSWQEYCEQHQQDFDLVAQAMMANDRDQSQVATNQPLNEEFSFKPK